LLLLSLTLTYYLAGSCPTHRRAGHRPHPLEGGIPHPVRVRAERRAVIDDKQRIVLANERIDEKFGYSRGEIDGQPADVLFPDRFRDAAPGHDTTAIVRLKPRGGRRPRRLRPPQDGAISHRNLDQSDRHPGRTLRHRTIIDMTARMQAAARLSAACRASTSFAAG